nr:F-box/kelch-repeat protein At5g42350-like [Ipomoea batatas]
MIAVGGLGCWDEPLDSGEIYDSVSNKWTEIPRLPVEFGVACSSVVCKGLFYVYSETDKLAAFDIERGYWIGIRTSPSPPRVHEYHPKLISCNGRLFMLSVSWCEGDGQIGRRNKAVRKLWELDLMYLTWTEVCIHPDAPMDWNATFASDKNLIFGVEMFKIFGQVLDFSTVCRVSDTDTKWKHISRNQVAHELDPRSPEIRKASSSLRTSLSTTQTALLFRFSVRFSSSTSRIGFNPSASHNTSTPFSMSTSSSNREDRAASAASTTFSLLWSRRETNFSTACPSTRQKLSFSEHVP